MAISQLGQYRLISAFGFRRQGSGKFQMLRAEISSSGSKTPNPWIDWYLGGFTIVENQLSLSDRVGGILMITE